MFPRQLHLDVECSTIENPMPPDISLAVVPDVDHTAVFREKLTNGVVSGYAAVLTEGYDDLVLENCFSVDKTASLVGGDLCRSGLFLPHFLSERFKLSPIFVALTEHLKHSLVELRLVLSCQFQFLLEVSSEGAASTAGTLHPP